MSTIRDGDVVLVLARVRQARTADGQTTVRIITAGSEGGPGFQQIVLPSGAVFCRLDDPSHAAHVPAMTWEPLR